MLIFAIIPLIIFIAIIFVIIVIIRNTSTKKSLSEASFQLVISYQDLLRQLLLGIAFIIGITALYAGFNSLGIEIGWYWVYTIGGLIASYICYKKHMKIIFSIGILTLIIGLFFGSLEDILFFQENFLFCGFNYCYD